MPVHDQKAQVKHVLHAANGEHFIVEEATGRSREKRWRGIMGGLALTQTENYVVKSRTQGLDLTETPNTQTCLVDTQI